MGARNACALALGLVVTSGCGQVDPQDDEADPDLVGSYQNVDVLVGSCSFAYGVVSVTSQASQTITVGKRSVDSVILVNGEVCSSTTNPPIPADATKMKRLVIRGSASDETLLLSLQNGLFAPGVSNADAGGIAIDMGGGADTVNVQGTASADTFYVGADGLAFNSDNYKDITYANIESLVLVLGAGADTVIATNSKPTRGVSGSARLPLSVFGGVGNDIILGGTGVDSLYGGPGNDSISGGAADDYIYGEEGLDTIQGSETADGSDIIDCGDEAPNTSVDMVSYDKRTRAISVTMGAPGSGGESSELDSINANCEGLAGGSANDTLTGNANANTLLGGPGDDTLTGAAGNDTLNGSDGNDTFNEEALATGADVFIGGAGIDLIDYSGRSANLNVTMDGANADDGAAGESDNVKADIENILCGSGDDEITGNTSGNRITGGAGNDRLNGGGGPDVFLEEAASNGRDSIVGGLGMDLVDYSARTGDLTITMQDDIANDGELNEHDGIGSDVENLKAGSGNDSITGNALVNVIEGGRGNDTISGGDGDDTLDGSDRTSTNNISCGAGADLALNAGLGSYAADCELTGI